MRIIHAFSGIAGEAVGVTYQPVNLLTRPRQVQFSPADAVFNTLFNKVPSDLRLCQAVTGVTSSYDAVLDLFECSGGFLERLEIYLTIPFTTVLTDVIIKIMAELLSVLALDFVWKAHHTGTAAWFLESDTLAAWKKTGSFLWIHGKRMSLVCLRATHIHDQLNLQRVQERVHVCM